MAERGAVRPFLCLRGLDAYQKARNPTQSVPVCLAFAGYINSIMAEVRRSMHLLGAVAGGAGPSERCGVLDRTSGVGLVGQPSLGNP